MFCQNCGAQVPEGSGFCTACGAMVEGVRPQYRYIPQPQYQFPPRPQHQAVNPEKKKVWLKEKAPAKSRRNGAFAVVICVIGVLLMAAGFVNAVMVPMYDIPAVSFCLTVVESDPDELIAELEGDLDEAKRIYKRDKHTYSESEQESMDKLMEAMEDVVGCFSVVNVFNLLDVMTEEWANLEAYSQSDVDEFVVVKNTLVSIIVVFAALYLLPLFFILLGGLNKSTGLTIVGVVLVIIPQACLGGLLLTLASLVLGVVQAVMCGKINREYARYRNYCLYGR